MRRMLLLGLMLVELLFVFLPQAMAQTYDNLLVVSMESRVQLEKGTICISYSSDEDVLRITYSTDDKECQLALSSTQRMGLLMQVVGSEITCSLRFLEEEETWPTDDTLEDEQYTSKTIFEAPGWIVIIVQKAE